MIVSENQTKFISPQTIIYDLLENYPELEEKLIEIAPVLIKLKNPVLRRTIAKITTLKQASVIADIPLADLINKLRAVVGQELTVSPAETKDTGNNDVPEWLKDAGPYITYDAGEDLEKGIHPLGKIMKEISLLQARQVYTLITPFTPAPLIDKVKEKGFRTWTKVNDGTTVTYISKASD